MTASSEVKCRNDTSQCPRVQSLPPIQSSPAQLEKSTSSLYDLYANSYRKSVEQ